MRFPAIRETVLRLVADRIEEPDALRDVMKGAQADASFVDLEVDSISTLDICLALERTFDLAIEPSDFVQYPSVNALAHYIDDTLPADFRLPTGAT